MKNKSRNKLAAFAFVAFAATSFAHAQSMAITGVVSETKGTTTNFVSPTASGSDANTTTWTTGVVGTFQMSNGAYMVVSATNPTGSLSTGTDSLMVARTTNSQGLTDTGSLSVYVRNVNASNVLQNTPWTLDLNYSFYTDASLSTPMNLGVQVTSLDIDFNQRYYTSSTDFTFNTTSGPSTNIVSAAPISGYNGYTASGDSTFNNPNHAVASWGYGNSFDVKIGHNAVALYMFEFRQPSQATGLVPEPSSALLALTGITALGFVRRRKANA